MLTQHIIIEHYCPVIWPIGRPHPVLLSGQVGEMKMKPSPRSRLFLSTL